MNTDITVQIETSPQLAFLDAKKFEAFFEAIKIEAASTTKDVSTNKSRDEIRSMAFKIAKTKAALNKARLGLTEEWRLSTKKANEAGKAIDMSLDGLADEVRAPLTAWEVAEKQRQDRVDADLAVLGQINGNFETAAMAQNVKADLEAQEFSVDVFRDQAEQAAKLKERALTILQIAIVRLTQEENDRAELAALREAQALREQAEAEEMAKANAAQQAKEREQADIDRIERLRVQAIEETKRAADQARLEAAAKHEAELKAAQDRADRIEREAFEEKAKVVADAARLERDRLAREQDREHRGKVMGAAKDALIEMGINPTKAKEIILAIAAGSVPAVSIAF